MLQEKLLVKQQFIQKMLGLEFGINNKTTQFLQKQLKSFDFC